jgi:hypothetical protein
VASIFKPENKIKLITEYENVTETVLFGNAVLAALMSGGKYGVIAQNGDCSKERNVLLWFLETNSVIKTQRRYRTQYRKDQLQIMLSDVG